MSLLDGRGLVVQITRAKVQELIQDRLVIRSTPLQPPFRLSVPGVSSPGPVFTSPAAAVDIVFRDVYLTFTPGSNRAVLRLEIEAGVVRPQGVAPLPLTTGELWITLEFDDNKVLSVRPVAADLYGLDSLGASLALADVEVDKILDSDRGKSTELLPEAFLPVNFTRALDANTLMLFQGASEMPNVERFTGNHDIAVALSANLARSMILCPALARVNQVATGDLPPVCGGGGGLDKGQDGIDVLIKTIDLDLFDGHIRVSGSFDAGDTCWEVRDGTFSQNLHLTVDPVTGNVVPTLDPLLPHTFYEPEVHFVCKALAFIAGLLIPRIGSVIVGLAFGVAVDIAASMADPDIPTPGVQGFRPPAIIPGVALRSIVIKAEGLALQGALAVDRFPAAYQPSAVSLGVTRQPLNVVEGPTGTTTYQAPPCEARSFQYRKFSQDEEVALTVKPEWLIGPLDCRWSVNGVDVPAANSGTLSFATTVRTALPLPNGVEVPGHAVQLGYRFPSFAFVTMRSPLTLSARGSDLNYTADVQVKVTDAAGRVFWNGAYLAVRGEFVTFGQDYNDYVDECFRRFRDIVDKKVLVKRRLKPGEPEERLDWMLRYLDEHMSAGSPHVVDIVEAGVAIHGVGAVNEVLAKKAASVMAKAKGIG
jgi:hypothetical protein